MKSVQQFDFLEKLIYKNYDSRKYISSVLLRKYPKSKLLLLRKYTDAIKDSNKKHIFSVFLRKC